MPMNVGEASRVILWPTGRPFEKDHRVRIQVRNSAGETIFGFDVDPSKPPTVVRSPHPERPTITLDWDRAVDDHRHLRRCPVCGCDDLFARKELPQVTALVAIVLAAVVAMVLLGLQMVGWAIALLAIVGAIDLGIFLYAKRVLECYRCRSVFRDVPIRRGHPRWEASLAERYRRQREAAMAGLPLPMTPAASEKRRDVDR
jgi:hypothetical protein